MRRYSVLSLLAATFFAFLIVPPSPAQASAFGCVGKSVRAASSCVRIWGDSTWVDNAAAGVEVGARTTVHGRVRLTVDGRVVGESGITCSNGAWDKTKYCEVEWRFRQHWRNGANVCGQFIFNNGQALNVACKTIIRK